ncbi:MAG: DUF924 domain-containing protein [SAR324 cluster bacterium]|nr:DUF924 domain-containing protein [SAR324 cluster bacterium]
MKPISENPQAVLDFWFSLRRPGKKDDGRVREALGGLYERAARGDLNGWAETPRERLALILLLDQAPRHLFRDHARAYATDGQAAALTAMFMEHGHWGDFTPLEIFYATHPWLHSEDAQLQARINPVYHLIAPQLPGLEYMARTADLYLDTLRRFGRFPHRNAVLGRASTAEETRFLSEEWGKRRRTTWDCPLARRNPFLPPA